ncbi:hypothetical protein [Paraburkholderia pallida]|uniref:Uncharacterized protein n=1 Tax=Paraburkholderia pallida TaxID=2547399 RepID=A0A4P7CPY9_9BURK|nr:hypothetical protein [Paraburkholderia pallida]QBQ97908.1 hypothetical protein E1956_12455 [Paraburkholderia pallida]
MQVRLNRANGIVVTLLDDRRRGISIDPEILQRELDDMQALALSIEDLSRRMRLVLSEMEELNRELLKRI